MTEKKVKEKTTARKSTPVEKARILTAEGWKRQMKQTVQEKKETKKKK